MSITARATKSIRKKSIPNQIGSYLGSKNIVFAHQATAGQTLINLGSLTTPSSLAAKGFVQAGILDIQAANLLAYRKNLRLQSSLRSILFDYDSYLVTGNTSIQLLFPAEEGEIFIGVISSVTSASVQTIDAKAICATGTLAAGATDFVVGQSFALNKYPTQQVGDVKVYIDGILQARNVGNATASATADGNYEELNGGSGLSNTIRFNVANPARSRSIVVVSNGMVVERPDGSLRAEIESLAGQVDQMIPTLATLAGVSETVFQSAPNDVDLMTFGSRVVALENNKIIGGQLPAQLNANTIAPGYVGERISSSVSNVNGSVGSINQITTIQLTPGVWDIDGFVGLESTGSLTGNTIISTTINTTVASGTRPENRNDAVVTSASGGSAVVPSYRISLNTAQTIFLLMQIFGGSGTGTFFGRITAVRKA